MSTDKVPVAETFTFESKLDGTPGTAISDGLSSARREETS
jgi:hypothetical protein